ncbi:MAG TPA: sigma-70 family RNA polymerase sigma factor [Myxococcales bacterium]
MTDAALIEACCAGDASAWQELRYRYRRDVYAALRKSADHADLDDLEQEVWTRLLTRDRAALRGFRGGSLGAFLSQVARSVCIDHYRRARPLAELNPGLASERPSAEYQLSHEEQRKRLASGLAQVAITARDRDVVRLHFEEELTAAQIADLGLGLSERGVEALFRRLRKRLRELVAKENSAAGES